MTLGTIEVVRPTTISGLATVADLATVVALSAVVAWLAMLGTAATGRVEPSPSVARGVRRTASVAVVGAFGLRLWSVVDAVDDLGLALSSRRVLAQGLLVVLVLALAAVRDDRVPLRDGERGVATAVLGVLCAAAVVLAGPRADSIAALATTAAFVGVALLVAVAGHALLGRRTARGGATWTAVAGLLVAVAAVGWPAVIVPSSTTSFSDELALGEADVLATFAPAQPGSNEVHVYVYGPDGALLPVESVRLSVDEAPPVELLSAGPGHLVALALSFEDADSWVVDLEATMLDGRTIVARTEVPRGG